jgi:ABC-type glycerol-3-phosphate transport system permease component
MASTTTTQISRPAVESQVVTARLPRRRPIQINFFRVFIYTVLTLGAALFVLPFLWMVSTSLQHSGDIIRGRFIPSLEFISISEVTDDELNRTLQDYLDADEFPSFLEDVRSQIEDSRAQREMTLSDYLRKAKIGYAELKIDIDIPLINKVWEVHNNYVVKGGVAHYVEAWDESNFSRYFFNSVKVVILTVIGQTFTSVLAAYAFARIEFPGRNLLFSLFLATIFIPTMVVLIPNWRIVTNVNKFFTEEFPRKQDDWGITGLREDIREIAYDVGDTLGLVDKPDEFAPLKPFTWKWTDSWPALVFPFLASTFSIFLLRQFFLQIPEDLWDAARIDGAGHLRFLFQVVVPISRAAIVTTIIFTFIGTWNALEWPMLVTKTDNWRPISYGLYAFQSESGTYLNLLMAGSVITLVPVLVLYLFAQKQFTEGIATTGLKG